MVKTSTSTVASTTSNTNSSNMLLYNANNNNNGTSPANAQGGESKSISVGGIMSCNTSTTLDQYRLQLYNYALSMERLRGGTPYTAAAAVAAAAAYASTTTVSTTTINCPPVVHGTNYTGSGQGTTAPPPASYLAGNFIAATTHVGRSQTDLSQCSSNNPLALASMSLFPQRIFQPEEPKPQHSYIGLIAMAILSSAERKLVLSDIYQYILDNYPYFRTRGPGWRNSIRHNLSLNDCFIKSGRSANGKGHYWAIHPANIEDFRKGDFRRRKAQRKVRKHMGLAIDDNATDSSSPPPAMDLTSPSSPASFQNIIMGSSTITPLATAAQHLAAQSFGWRFTRQQQLHHHQQQTSSHTSTSYMGQIFTYRPQHYAAAAVAAAAALRHNGNTQQHQQHQQLQNLATHNPCQQLPSQLKLDASFQQQNLLSVSTQSSITTNVQVNVINELFSQKRKRQFDVASLLAPDNLNKHECERERQHQYTSNHIITETERDDVRLSPSNEGVEENPTAAQNDVEMEDIDVVEASEDEDIEADYEHDDDDDEDDDEEVDNSSSNSRSPTLSHSPDDDEEAVYIRNYNSEHTLLRINTDHFKISKLQMSTEEEKVAEVYRARQYKTNADNDDEETIDHIDDDNNNNQSGESYNHGELQNGRIVNTIVPTLSSMPPPPPSSTTQLLEKSNDLHHQTNHHPQPLNAETNHLFGHYYGTYMAAAAARINS